MVTTIVINVKDQHALNKLNKIKHNLPRDMGEAGYFFSQTVERNMKLELNKQKLIWRGNLISRVQARRLSRFRSVVFVPQHGIYLDSMKPHYVKLKRGRLIRLWAMQKGNEALKKIAKREGSIYVKPHPWMDAPLNHSLDSLPSILQRYADKSVMS